MTTESQDVRVIATARVRPEARADLLAQARAFIDATRREDGCIAYDLLASVSDPGALATIERWSHRGAALAHLGAPHTQTFLAALAAASDGSAPAIALLDGTAESLI